MVGPGGAGGISQLVPAIRVEAGDGGGARFVVVLPVATDRVSDRRQVRRL
jgi:hypothetical protein